MNSTPDDNQFDNDLDLLAFQYVAGELAVSDAEAFESRLSQDQDAREAVAAAVEIAQAIHASEQRDVYSSVTSITAQPGRDDAARGVWSQRLQWMSVGGVVALVIATVCLYDTFANRTTQTATTDNGGPDQRAVDVSAELASSWYESMTDEGILARDVAAEPTQFRSNTLSALSADALALDDEMVAPLWMVAAVAETDDDLDGLSLEQLSPVQEN